MIRHACDFENFTEDGIFVEFPQDGPGTSWDPLHVSTLGTKKCLSGEYANWTGSQKLQYNEESTLSTDLGEGWVHLRVNVRFTSLNRMVKLWWYNADELIGQCQIYLDSSYAGKLHVKWNLYANIYSPTAYTFDHYYPAIGLDNLFHTIRIRFSKAKLISSVDTETEQESAVPADFGAPTVNFYKVELTPYAYYSFYEFHQVDQDIYDADDYNQLLADGVAEPNVTINLWEVSANPPTFTLTSGTNGDVSFATVDNGDYYMAATSDGNYCWFQQIRVVSHEIQ